MKVPESLGTLGERTGTPSPSDDPLPLYDTYTDALARNKAHDSSESRITPPSSVEKGEDHSLFRDPTMATSVDFQSQDGFKMAAKKKKGKAAKSAWDDDEDEKKKEEGEGGGEGGEGGDKSGDIGAGGDGDKKDEANGDGAGGNPPEDDWDAFLPAKGKKGKKGKKAAAEEVAPAVPAAEKFDAFHEIKLDDTGPMLDLSFDTGTKPSTGGFGSWGSSWNTGTTK